VNEIIIQPTITLTFVELLKPTGSDLLNCEEAAQVLSVSIETVRRLCRKKALTFTRVTGTDYRFRRGDLDEYLESRTTKRKKINP
jgi:excisionase family DNA binding protein